MTIHATSPAFVIWRPLAYTPAFSATWSATLDRPETLLKSALEKIVFFECRIDQLTSDLARAGEEISRLKADLADAARREVALKQELAATEQRAGQALRERDEEAMRASVSREERERFLSRLIEAEQIRNAGEECDGIDLASFIAELRAEVIALRAAQQGPSAPGPAAPAPPATPAPQPPPARQAAPRPAASQGFSSTEQAARSLADAGRLGVNELDREALRASARFETRTEETLFALSLRELASGDPLSRTRAAQRLKALGPKAALPAVAAALNAEDRAEAICAYLEVFAAAGDPSVLPLVSSRRSSPEVEIRLAALETSFRLGAPEALEAAMSDPSALVRRRAAVLASAGEQRPQVLERALQDGDPSVRRVAVLGLSAAAGSRAESRLLSALDDADPTVRRSAAKGLSRAFGPEVFAIADAEPGRRRREIRRLAALPQSERAALPAPEPSRAPPAPEPVPAAPPPALALAPAAPEQRAPAEASPEPASRAAEEAAGAEPSPLEQEVLGRVYAALRGQSGDDLVKNVNAPPEVVLAAASALERSGKLVRRGQRYFVP